MLWELLLILVLVLANGFFAGAEIAVIAARRGRLEQRAEAGSRGAQRALELARDPNRFLPTVQVGITLVSALGAAYGGRQIVGRLSQVIAESPVPAIQRHAEGIALAGFVLVFTYVSLVVGELVPKRVALRRAERVSILVAPVMHSLATLARPAVWLMGMSTSAVLRLFRLHTTTESAVSLDDIEHLIKTGIEEGILEPVESRLAVESLRLGEHSVMDVMRPRIDLDAIDVATPPDEVLGTVAMAGFSRVPVYEGDLDHILGYVHTKDVLRQLHLGWPIELRKLMRPALFVPETMQLDRLLELFQQQRNRLAIVLNEYGGTEGVVTLEDVVEEIVGEIRHEHRRDVEPRLVRQGPDSWLVDGGIAISVLAEQLQISGHETLEIRGFHTVAGLVLDQLGHLPAVGDGVDWGGLHLEVVDMAGRRIDRVLVTRPASAG